MLPGRGRLIRLLDQIESAGVHLGCEELARRLETLRPQAHIFGHIHSGYGAVELRETLYLNASILDEQYKIAHRPLIFDIDRGEVVLVKRRK